MDQRIDTRISSVLQEWEVSTKNFEKAEKNIIRHIKEEYSKVFAQLEELEKRLRDMHGGKEETTASKSSMTGVMPDDKPREFRVDVASERDEDQHTMHSILTSLVVNPASLFNMKKKRQQTQQRNAEMFKVNRVRYMEEHSKLALMRLKESDRAIHQLVDDQLMTAAKSMDVIFSSAHDRINSNRSLLTQLQKDKRERPQLETTYRPLAEKLNEVLEDTIRFMYENIHDYDFPENSWISQMPSDVQCPKQREVKQASVVSIMSQMNDSTKQQVSVKQMALGSCFKWRHLYFMARNLR